QQNLRSRIIRAALCDLAKNRNGLSRRARTQIRGGKQNRQARVGGAALHGQFEGRNRVLVLLIYDGRESQAYRGLLGLRQQFEGAAQRNQRFASAIRFQQRQAIVELGLEERGVQRRCPLEGLQGLRWPLEVHENDAQRNQRIGIGVGAFENRRAL